MQKKIIGCQFVWKKKNLNIGTLLKKEKKIENKFKATSFSRFHFLFFFTARLLYSQYKRNYKWIIIHDYSLDISIELQIIKLIKPSLVLRLNSQDATIYKTHKHTYTLGSNAPYRDNFHDKIIRTRHRLVVKDGVVHSLLTKREGKKKKLQK